MLQLYTNNVLSGGKACEDPQVAGNVPERRLRFATVAPSCNCSKAGKATLLPQAVGRVPEKGVSCKNSMRRDGKAPELPQSGGSMPAASSHRTGEDYYTLDDVKLSVCIAKAIRSRVAFCTRFHHSDSK